MTRGRLLALALAVLLFALGAVWTAYGQGWLGEGENESWAVIGPIFAGLGVALAIVVVQNRNQHR
ncbi:hypothetical protein [Nocardioides sp. R-C-SC26]|uniref:hypothetical protein n=1 Tax=Nocardioides sp. R-C-SC26 TaxID=2870414 RepID=UPI001E5FF865|nr:hypothetical protein [Nocardioides sp. R-C-SC26]